MPGCFLPHTMLARSIEGLQNRIYVGHAGADGNCHDRSTMLSITGEEAGHMGLRLRNAMHLSRHYPHYVGHDAGLRQREMRQILTPGGY
jgi:hypothetical protein